MSWFIPLDITLSILHVKYFQDTKELYSLNGELDWQYEFYHHKFHLPYTFFTLRNSMESSVFTANISQSKKEEKPFLFWFVITYLQSMWRKTALRLVPIKPSHLSIDVPSKKKSDKLTLYVGKGIFSRLL